MAEKEKTVEELQVELTTKIQEFEELTTKFNALTVEKTEIASKLDKASKDLKKAKEDGVKNLELAEKHEAAERIAVENLEKFKARTELEKSESKGSSLTFADPTKKAPEGHGTFTLEGVQYLITASKFRHGKDVVTASDLAANAELQAEMLNAGVGFIVKMEGK